MTALEEVETWMLDGGGMELVTKGAGGCDGAADCTSSGDGSG